MGKVGLCRIKHGVIQTLKEVPLSCMICVQNQNVIVRRQLVLLLGTFNQKDLDSERNYEKFLKEPKQLGINFSSQLLTQQLLLLARLWQRNERNQQCVRLHEIY